MDCVFVVTQNSYVDTLTPGGMILGGGSLGLDKVLRAESP